MSIVIAIILVTLTGLLCSVMLVVASHFMMVPTNEKEEKLRNCLPGANCGACGYTGCDSYAKALAEDETVKTNLCVPGADKVAKELAEVLGVKALDVVEKVAFIHCFGDCTKRTKKNEYEGLKSCLAGHDTLHRIPQGRLEVDTLCPQRSVRPGQEDTGLHSRGAGPVPVFAADTSEEPSLQLA